MYESGRGKGKGRNRSSTCCAAQKNLLEFFCNESRLSSGISRTSDSRPFSFRCRTQHPLNRINEENAYKDEGNLDSIDDFGYNSRPGNKGESLPANNIWEGRYQEAEHDHFCSQELKYEFVVDCHSSVERR